MNIRKISLKIIVLYSIMMAVLLLPLIIINRASIASILAVIVLVVGYIAGELYLLIHKMDEEKKELLHLGLIGIPLSIIFLILALTFWIYGFGTRGVMPSILFVAVYCLSGILFTILYYKRVRSGRKEKRIASMAIGPIIGAMIGLMGAKYLLKDASQNTMIFILLGGSYLLSITFLLGALSSFCKFIARWKEQLNDHD